MRIAPLPFVTKALEEAKERFLDNLLRILLAQAEASQILRHGDAQFIEDLDHQKLNLAVKSAWRTGPAPFSRPIRQTPAVMIDEYDCLLEASVADLALTEDFFRPSVFCDYSQTCEGPC